MLCCAFLVTAVQTRAREKVRDATAFVGLVTRIDPGHVTVLGIDGREITFRSQEDYRDEVAVGTKVTAWYYPQSSDKILKSLDYPQEVFFVPAPQIRARLHKIIILPRSNCGDADRLYESTAQFLEDHLDWYVAPAALAAEIRARAEANASTLDAIDPATGKFDLTRYMKSQGLIPTLTSETRTEGVLEIDVDPAEARVDHMVAAWDGVEEPLAGPGIRALSKFTVFAGKGELPASTITLKLFDRRGALLWRNRRGLALLVVPESGVSNKLRERPLAKYLASATDTQKWLSKAFASLVGSTAQAGTTSPR